MKYLQIIFFALLISCNPKNSTNEVAKKEFTIVAQRYQGVYMDGGSNCDEILSNIDENVKMWEGGKIWTYSDLKEYCEYLLKKNVIETYTDQDLMSQNLSYDFVSQLYISQSGDTIRETSSRIWRNKTG